MAVVWLIRRRERTMAAIEERLAELGHTLPAVNPGILAPAVRTGNLVYTSGACSAVKGKLGGNVTVEEGYAGARDCIIQNLASVKWLIGDLDKVTRVVKLLGLVNCAEDFSNTPAVINGATETLVEVFGKEKGWHARSAIGVYQLPGDAAVEIEMIVEVAD
jgi:enamine deaminase RidA (YjgF/YER057c/UK114 family)